jgi:hypothetical protein
MLVKPVANNSTRGRRLRSKPALELSAGAGANEEAASVRAPIRRERTNPDMARKPFKDAPIRRVPRKP